MYSKDLLLGVLRKYGYPDHMINCTIERLNNMEPEIKQLFDHWLHDGSVPNDNVCGYTYSELIGQKYRFTPINAFLTLNWLLVDTSAAIAALEGGIR